MLPASGMRGGRGLRGALAPRTGMLLSPTLLPASSAAAEFLGTLLLQLLAGGTSAAWRAAATYAALTASFARHSGGHLNPSLSLAAALSGHLSGATAALYIFAQVLGALAGAALQVVLTPGLSWGVPFAPSCHAPLEGLGGTGLYIWETVAAFAFVYVAYPAIFARPGYGALAPLVLGTTLLAVVSTAGALTGGSLVNPALSLAGSLVFDCGWRWSWMYWLAQATGAGLAALLGVGVFGVGPAFQSEEERAGGGQDASAYDPLLMEAGGGVGVDDNARLQARVQELSGGGMAAPAGSF